MPLCSTRCDVERFQFWPGENSEVDHVEITKVNKGLPSSEYLQLQLQLQPCLEKTNSPLPPTWNSFQTFQASMASYIGIRKEQALTTSIGTIRTTEMRILHGSSKLGKP
jgi:hypothetical protein